MTHVRKDRPEAETPPPAPVEAAVEGAKVGEAGMTWLWRISGGALLVAAALVGVGVYQNLERQQGRLKAQLAELNQELRRDLGRLSESHGSMIKKDEHTLRLRTVWDTIKEMRGDHADLARIKERCAVLQELYRAGEDERRQMADEVRRLREAQAGDGDRQALAREIRALRERLARIEGRPVSHVEPVGGR